MVNPKKIFLVFIFLVSGVGLWIGGQFVCQLHHYLFFSHSTLAEANEWRVEELKPGKFTICVNVTFWVEGTKLHRLFKFSKPVYQNHYLADACIKKWEKGSWQVWYNPKNLKMISLQKIFPFKTGIYFILSVGLLLYFWWLGIYMRVH